MNNILVFSLCFLLYLCSIPLHGQTRIDHSIQTSSMVKLGYITSLQDLDKSKVKPSLRRNKVKRSKAINQNLGGRSVSKVTVPNLEHQGPDPLRQFGFDTQNVRSSNMPIVNVEGNTWHQSPNDPSGEIGLDHYVQVVNVTTIAIFEKNGVAIDSFKANLLWQEVGHSSFGDPICIYDQEMNRWIITEFAAPNIILFAMSDNADPFGGWSIYAFGAPNFPDYPKWSVWPNSYALTTNELGGGFQHFYFFNRAQLLAGEESIDMQRIEIEGSISSPGPYIATPVDWSGANPPPPNQGPIFIIQKDSSWGIVDEDGIAIYEVDVDWEDPGKTIVNEQIVITTPFDGYPCATTGIGFACIPQPDGEVGLSGFPEIIMYQPHYRNFGTHQSFVCAFIVDITDGENISGIRWMEFRKTEETDWDIYQEGTFGPDDGLHRFIPTISIDGKGNIAMAYAVANNEVAAGLRYTGRLASDPLGIMTVPEVTVVDGGSSLPFFSRFGDYAHMTVDPTNENTFWFTAEYAGLEHNIKTRIVAFQLDIDSFDLSPIAVSSPIDAIELGNEIVTTTIKNYGSEPISSFSIAYSLNGEEEVIEDVIMNIEPGESVHYSFSERVDLSEIKTHQIAITVYADQDQNQNNNIFQYNVEHIPVNDPGLQGILVPVGDVCGTSTEVAIIVSNTGTAPLQEVPIEINLNEEFNTSVMWTGNLERLERDTISVNIDGLLNDENTITARLDQNDPILDQNQENNEVTATLSVNTEWTSLFVEILTDRFPEETSWSITDTSGTVYGSSNFYTEPYQWYIHEICVPPDACFTMRIFDSYGDGLSSAPDPAGNYIIKDAEENVLATLQNVNFGDVEINSFCNSEPNCMLSSELIVTPDTNNGNGSILFETSGGFPPLTFSIDGGASFQDDPLFTNLESANYVGVVVDGIACEYEENVDLPGVSSSDDTWNKPSFTFSPNPTKDIVTLTIEGVSSTELFVDYILLNEKGQRLQKGTLVRYDHKYKGMISLVYKPAGVYYVMIRHPEVPELSTIIKQ